MIKTKNNNFNSYEYIENELKFFINSKIRMKILNCLLYEPLTMKDIHIKANLTYSSISNNIHKLEERGYITQISGKYQLSNLIKMKLWDIIDFNDSINVLNEYSNFWRDHNTESINIESLKKISQLKGSKIIESNPTDIYKTHNYFKKLLKRSKNVKSIFPFVHPEYYTIFENLMKNKANIEFLLPKSIANSFIKSMNQNLTKIRLNEGKLKIKSLNNVEFALTVANNFMSFGLFKVDNSYDQNKILISKTKEAIDWGNKTFEIYKSFGKNLYLSL
ncbi:MAG: DUF1724 domain-containing protein [Methanobacteriaceae archaeon]|jgi:predicted transcriptional regulator|nr:DUF1724 domain-containing protein [Candidatus Methanorudis spinitermitis]